jgi:two-component system, OmpR family, phosphate regulon response regulator OmpR
MSREALMDRVRGEEFEAFDRRIDVHIARVRAAIEDDPKHPRRIITVRGAGYVFTKSQDDERERSCAGSTCRFTWLPWAFCCSSACS